MHLSLVIPFSNVFRKLSSVSINTIDFFYWLSCMCCALCFFFIFSSISYACNCQACYTIYHNINNNIMYNTLAYKIKITVAFFQFFNLPVLCCFPFTLNRLFLLFLIDFCNEYSFLLSVSHQSTTTKTQIFFHSLNKPKKWRKNKNIEKSCVQQHFGFDRNAWLKNVVQKSFQNWQCFFFILWNYSINTCLVVFWYKN